MWQNVLVFSIWKAFKVNYIFLDDDKLLGFLYRTHKYIKFTGLTYPSLKGIDDLILNT